MKGQTDLRPMKKGVNWIENQDEIDAKWVIK